MIEQKILDKGYLKLIEHWGSDERIIEAARMSTNKGFQGWESDKKLLSYLYKNQHMTPFEMCGAVIEVQAPIFIFREWHRHRTQSYNEMSARYTPLPDVNYIPTTERLQRDGGNNKQAQGAQKVTNEIAISFINDLEEFQIHVASLYNKALQNGIPKELARLVIPVMRYSKMRASANLRNWLQFLTLRQAPNAQWEIQQYANVLNQILSTVFPKTMELYNANYSRND